MKTARQRRGRPRKAVSATMVERLATIQCTVAEIAAVCDCSEDTVTRNFAAALKKGREGGKASLRRAQWKAAVGGNATMLIWLGKQLLGQRDRQEHEVRGNLIGLDAVRALMGAAGAEERSGERGDTVH